MQGVRATGSRRLARAFGPVIELPPRKCVAALTLLAASLRLPFLFRAPADVDETWSWYFIELVRSGHGVLETFASGLDGPLFVALDLAVARVTGESLQALRVPPALFGTLAVPLAWRAFSRLHGPRLGLVAAAATAASPFLVFYSMQARPYAQMLAGCLLFTGAAAGPAEDRGARERALVAGAGLLAMASHYYAIVFLGTWYALRVGAALLERRVRPARAEATEGLLVLVASSPLLALLLARLRSIGAGYWHAEGLELAGILTDLVFLAGASLGETRAALVGLGLVLLPFGLAALRRPRVFLEQPWLLLGPGMPLLAAGAGLVLDRSVLFYPRAYIAAVPFLLAALAVLVAEFLPRRPLRWACAALLLGPALASTAYVARASPQHPFYRERHVLGEIARTVASHGGEGAVVAVHHWYLTQFLAYYHPGPARVVGLGTFRRNTAARNGEAHAALVDAIALPDRAPVVLVRNALASGGSDPQGLVRAALGSERPLLWEGPCRPEPSAGEEVFCDRIFLFGPVTGARAGE